MDNLSQGFTYLSSGPTWSNWYLWPVLGRVVNGLRLKDKRAFEIGCGNGATADFLFRQGFDVTGVDLSESGIEQANMAFPQLKLFQGNAYDNLAEQYGRFPLVVSLEVIEHCYYPRKFLQTFYDLLENKGCGVISTPYHGYWKNLALAVTGKWDKHHTVLWDGGHIKFFSEKTLTVLLKEVGFEKISFMRAGRIPIFAKSLVAVVEK